MAGMASTDDDPVVPVASAPRTGAQDAGSGAALPLVRLHEDAAGVCTDGVCRLSD